MKDPIEEAAARVESIIISSIKSDWNPVTYTEKCEARMEALARVLYVHKEDQDAWLESARRWRDSDDD